MTRSGGVYTPKTTVDYEKLVAAAWNNTYGMLALEGKLRVTINAYTDRANKQDVDNIAKSILDGLQRAGAFSHGDDQVWCLSVIKWDSKERLCAVVAITPHHDYIGTD
jgi:Holliday junction resolvase RusA-like endonuclease